MKTYKRFLLKVVLAGFLVIGLGWWLNVSAQLRAPSPPPKELAFARASSERANPVVTEGIIPTATLITNDSELRLNSEEDTSLGIIDNNRVVAVVKPETLSKRGYSFKRNGDDTITFSARDVVLSERVLAAWGISFDTNGNVVMLSPQINKFSGRTDTFAETGALIRILTGISVVQLPKEN